MEFTKSVNLTTTDATEVFTVPTGFRTLWNYCYITNNGGSANTLTLTVEKATSAPNFSLLEAASFDSKAREALIDDSDRIIVQSGDVIRATAGSVGDFEIVCTFTLAYSPLVFTNIQD